jgi:hypothetical protein
MSEQTEQSELDALKAILKVRGLKLSRLLRGMIGGGVG